MLDTPLMSLLETSLDYASTQQSAIASNISNFNTPGYQRKDASFATVLEEASDGSGSLKMTQGEGPSANQDQDAGGEVPIVTDSSGAMRVDGSNVDVDTEMAKLAKNQIYYQAVSQFMGGQITSLKYVIGGG